MNTCGNCHDEIVYEGRGCPLCVALDEIERLMDCIVDLENAERNHECQS
jgi:hypothetical protein